MSNPQTRYVAAVSGVPQVLIHHSPSLSEFTQAGQKAQAHNLPEMNTNAALEDAYSRYAPSTTSTKASFSSSISSRFGSLAKLPLLSRVKHSSTESSQASSSQASSSRTSSPHPTPKPSESKRQKPRDPVKSVPSGKPPATNFADLAYRYGTPSAPNSGRL